MRNRGIIISAIMVFWFVISFITNIIGPLVPDIITSFQLSHLALVGFIPTSFFLAYAIMSIPAGIIAEKIPIKGTLMIGFSLPLAGALVFAANPAYETLLISCFIIGLGMSMLQTVINPLTRTAGGEENFSFFSVMGQLIFGLASFVSPFFYIYLTNGLTGGDESLLIRFLATITPVETPWISLYWVFALVLGLMIVLVYIIPFPHTKFTADEKVGTWTSIWSLLKDPAVMLFFFGIFAYVAFEQGVANWISTFLTTYHGVDPQESAKVVGYFWGSMSIGCLAGLFVLRVFDAQKVLLLAVIGASLCLAASLTMPLAYVLYSFPMISFFISVMFSIVMSLGLNSFQTNHGSLAGIFCSGIVGGAFGPFVIGFLADYVGLKYALAVLFIPLAFLGILAIGARPLVKNKTVKIFKKAVYNNI